MKTVIVFFVATVALGQSDPTADLLAKDWKTFKLLHGKTYDNKTKEDSRMKIFEQNKLKIEEHNDKYEQGLVSYKLGLNKFADMLQNELLDSRNGLNRTQLNMPESRTFFKPGGVKLPYSVDWRKRGAVTRVKYQQNCNSGWAFAVTGALEGQHFLQTGDLVSLSEQNLIDCSHQWGNSGCYVGSMAYAFQYIKDNGGIDTEESYPYEAQDGYCRYSVWNKGATASGYVILPRGNEQQLQAAVATVGPIAVGIHVTPKFQFYTGGIYYEPRCDPNYITHGVLVVGYGTDDYGTDYWLVKNSWGRNWGENGYIRMARNRNNNCGIATYASYPTV